jgi:peroxiredoxin
MALDLNWENLVSRFFRLSVLFFAAFAPLPGAAQEIDHSRDPIPPGYAVPEGFIPAAGQLFPNFELPSSVGTSTSLESFRGAPTVIGFFFSSCGPCIRDVPALNKFQVENPEINVVAITFESVETAVSFIEEQHFQWPVLVEAQDYFDSIGVLAFPSFALLDASGRMLDATYGNRLGGEDGTVTTEGLQKWVRSHSP